MQLRIFALPVMIVLFACSDYPLPQVLVGPEASTSGARLPNGPVPHAPRSIEDVFGELGREIPGFAGFYVNDDGVLVVRLTNRAHATQARALLRETALSLSGTAQKAPSDEVIVQDAEFDFEELRWWRDQLRSQLGISGVTGMDADERANRVWIGVASEAMRGLLLSRAERLGIPGDALIIEQFASPPPLATLRDSIRPLPGGMLIAGALECTMTATGIHNQAGSGFLTASYCTDVRGTIEETEFFQPSSSGEYIGYEVYDTPLWTGYPCPSGRVCSYADAAFVQYLNAGTGEFGTIAQPASKCTSNCVDNMAALTISSTDPRWHIVSDYTGSIAQGIGLQKVGMRTGWTSGLVTNTCYDWNDPDSSVTRLCQVVVDGIAAHGDSGAPVVRFVAGGGPNKVSLYGMLFAGDPGAPAFVFSPWPNITAAIGSIATHDPDPLVADITGLYEVQEHVSCSWDSDVSGGTGPYTYAWRREGQLVSTSWSYSTSDTGTTDFSLTLEVTDANDADAFDSRTVQVEGAGQFQCTG